MKLKMLGNNMKFGLWITLILVLALTACGPSEAEIAISATETEAARPTSTPLPSATPSPTQTPTPTFTPTPTPVLASLIKDAVMFSGPDEEGYAEVAVLAASDDIEPIGVFGDFVLGISRNDPSISGYLPASALASIPAGLPALTVEEVPWQEIKSLASEDSPIEKNNTTRNWQETLLWRNVRFTDTLEIQLDVESFGSNQTQVIIKDSVSENGPWWSDRILLSYRSGILDFSLWDREAEHPVFSDYVALPDSVGSFTTAGEVTIRIEQLGALIKVLVDGDIVLEVAPSDFGDFRNGLFSDGALAEIRLGSEPQMKITITKFVFRVPPDGRFE